MPQLPELKSLPAEDATAIYCDASVRLGKSAAVGFAVLKDGGVLFTTASPCHFTGSVTDAEAEGVRVALEYAASLPPPTVVYTDCLEGLRRAGFPKHRHKEYEMGRWLCWMPKKTGMLGQRLAHDAANMLSLRIAEDLPKLP